MVNRIQKTLDAAPIKQLADRVGRAEAAELLGVSSSSLSGWFEKGEAYQPVVLAARYHLSKLDKKHNSTAIAIVVVPSDKRQAFDSVVIGFGLDCNYVVK